MMSHTQAGVTTKQARFVMTVTMILTASLPPANRVQTVAEAIVQGTAAAMTSPMAKSPLSRVLAGQAINGTTTALMITASRAGPGRRTAFHMALPGIGSAMRRSTPAMTQFLGIANARAEQLSGNAIPAVSTNPRRMRNQCRFQKLLITLWFHSLRR